MKTSEKTYRREDRAYITGYNQALSDIEFNAWNEEKVGVGVESWNAALKNVQDDCIKHRLSA